MQNTDRTTLDLIASAPAETRRALTAALDVARAWSAGRASVEALCEASRAAREAADDVARTRGVWWTRGAPWPDRHEVRFATPFSRPRPTADLDAAYRAVFLVYAAEARATGQRETRATYYERAAAAPWLASMAAEPATDDDRRAARRVA